MKLLAAMVLCGATGLPAQQVAKGVLHDFRIDGKQGRIQYGSEVSLEIQRQVLSSLFPKYLIVVNGCKGAEDQQPITDASLATKRQRGQMVPVIEEFARGSFTGLGRRQMAYFIKVGECFAETRTYWGTYRLAVFEGPHLIASLEPAANVLEAAADVNGDGIDELLLGAIGSGTGDVMASARLVSLRGGKLHMMKAFDSVYDNPCGFDGHMSVTASVITYTPAGLLTERYEAPCKASPGGIVPLLKDFTRVP
jgi:hypothetical protein